MRFSFAALTLCKGGGQRTLVEISNGLTRKGYEVFIVMPSDGVVEYDIAGTLVRSQGSGMISWRDYPKSDVIISNYYTTVPSAQKACEQGKGIHVRLSMCYEPLCIPENHLSFPSYNVTNRLLVVSKWQQQIIWLNHGIMGHNIPTGVSSVFRNNQFRGSDQPAIRVFAMVRWTAPNFGWHRDQDYLIRQLRIVKERRPEISINLICPPSELKNSPNLQQLRGWRFWPLFESRTFQIHTPKDDEELCELYNQADIFASSSIQDTFGMPGLEAMSCGAALVTTYSGGNVEYCKAGLNCLMSYRHENRLAEDIISLIDDQDLRNQLAIEGEKEARQWTWERCVDLFERAIHEFMNLP